jgi:hypothetical protein
MRARNAWLQLVSMSGLVCCSAIHQRALRPLPQAGTTPWQNHRHHVLSPHLARLPSYSSIAGTCSNAPHTGGNRFQGGVTGRGGGAPGAGDGIGPSARFRQPLQPCGGRGWVQWGRGRGLAPGRPKMHLQVVQRPQLLRHVGYVMVVVGRGRKGEGGRGGEGQRNRLSL